MIKTIAVALALTLVLSGCAKNPAFDRSMRKLLVGHDGLTCSEHYEELLIEGYSQESARSSYQACLDGDS